MKAFGSQMAVITARDSYINSDSTAATTWTGDVPSVAAGDLMVAVIMDRESGGTVTPPTGWTQQGPKYLNSIVVGGSIQNLSVYTKVAAASEPSTVTWTQATSSRICGFIASLVGNSFTMGTVAENYGNGEYASISNTGADFYITAATWVYTSGGTTTPESYSQTGSGVTEISDSPQTQPRISGGYTSTSGVVESTHASNTATNSPNHGMISIPFTINGDDGGGGGSTRPTSGMLYPRGQG